MMTIFLLRISHFFSPRGYIPAEKCMAQSKKAPSEMRFFLLLPLMNRLDYDNYYAAQWIHFFCISCQFDSLSFAKLVSYGEWWMINFFAVKCVRSEVCHIRMLGFSCWQTNSIANKHSSTTAIISSNNNNNMGTLFVFIPLDSVRFYLPLLNLQEHL